MEYMINKNGIIYKKLSEMNPKERFYYRVYGSVSGIKPKGEHEWYYKV